MYAVIFKTSNSPFDSIMSICQGVALCIYRYPLQRKIFPPSCDEEEGEGLEDEGNGTDIANATQKFDAGINEHINSDLKRRRLGMRRQRKQNGQGRFHQ